MCELRLAIFFARLSIGWSESFLDDPLRVGLRMNCTWHFVDVTCTINLYALTTKILVGCEMFMGTIRVLLEESMIKFGWFCDKALMLCAPPKNVGR